MNYREEKQAGRQLLVRDEKLDGLDESGGEVYVPRAKLETITYDIKGTPSMVADEVTVEQAQAAVDRASKVLENAQEDLIDAQAYLTDVTAMLASTPV